MKTPTTSSLLRRIVPLSLGLISASLFAPFALAQTTGFNQAGAGPFDYNTTGNWVAGTINGIWDASLTLTAAQTVTFDSNLPLLTSLNIGYTGNVDLTFRSDGAADRTITLGGDISVAPVSNRTINFGSTTANQGLNVNLAGNRTFNVAGSKTLRFYNTISGGNIVVTGGGTVSLNGSTANAATSDIEVQSNSTLYIDTTSSGMTGTTRANDVTLQAGSKLFARGNNGANTEDIISGNVTIGGSSAGTTFTTLASITVQPGTKNSRLTIAGLEQVNGGVGLIRGTSLGANTIASATAGTSNVQVSGTAPTLVGGGGAAGSTNISIVPWLVGGTTVSDTGSTFLTYTAANGFRPLDTATEFATGITDGATSTNNVLLTADTTLTQSTTINSLLVNPAAATTISGGTLNITSGAVLINPANSPNVTTTISSDLNFNTAQGILGTNTRKVVFNKISGSGGLVFYSTSGISGAWTSGSGANSSDYTGDTYIYTKLDLYSAAANAFLPSSTRTGDVYVYGQLLLAQGTQTINGLNGNGLVNYGHSNVSTLILGDNNSNGDFSGILSNSSGFNDVSVIKIGDGTQKFSGSSSLYNRSTTVRGGTLEITSLADGGSASSIGGSSNVSTNLVLNGGTLKYSGAATSTDRLFQVGETTAGGTGTIAASGTGAVNFTNTGSITYGTNNQSRTLTLRGTNTGDNTLAALIADNGSGSVSLTKSDSGTWVLSGANTYTGATTVNAGVLALGAADRIANTSNLVMAGGTFATRGFSETLGTLTLTANSTIDLGAGASALVFADSSSTSWTSSVTLSFVNFDAGIDSIQIGTSASGLTNDQLAQIYINGHYALIDSNGFLSMGAAIPEPSTYALLAGAATLLLVAGRRRVRNRFAA